MKVLNGAEIAGYMKENQAHQVRALRSQKSYPKLAIIRDNKSPVIEKYVRLKQDYGADIGVEVEDWLEDDIESAIERANEDPAVDGMIVQLPLSGNLDLDSILAKISPDKDVDGLNPEKIYHQTNNPKNEYLRDDIFRQPFESATATAINWLLAGYDINLAGKKIALVGRGRLVGRPLQRMWNKSGYDVTFFHRGDDLAELKNFDVIVSATGVPHLIKSEMVGRGAVVVDAGTASEDGVLVGDIDDSVRERKDLEAITPKVGGVGPLTVTALFENVLIAAKRKTRNN